MTYDLKDAKVPALKGAPLSMLASVLESPLRGPILKKLLADAGVMAARAVSVEEEPLPNPATPLVAGSASLAALPAGERREMPLPRVRDFVSRYQDGSLSPEAVAEHVLEGQQKLASLKAFIAVDAADVRERAKESAARWRKGAPLSVLDGVPIAIKDEIDCLPYPTTGGTSFMKKAEKDSVVAERLKKHGALIIGKANMHEIGINPTGFNAHHGQARNPHDPARDTGGSSSGSAAAVASGLCPSAIGADGGGSVRLPASLCGLVGLKPTFGRVSENGAVPLCWSVAHIGPLSTSVEDAALTYAAIADSPSLEGAFAQDLKGVRLGVYAEWNEHCAPEIAAATKAMLDVFTAAGATVHPIEVPELELERVAHNITIISEMAAAMRDHAQSPKAHGAGVRLTLAAANALSSADYVWAQRVRRRRMAVWREIYSRVDVVITPGTAAVAPLLPDPMPSAGWSDLSTSIKLMRYIIAGNFCGFPAISFPSGYDASGLPLSVQAMGRAWEEHLLLRVAHVAELAVQRRRPKVFFEVI
jgi:Asp-tRNA(Asn)/Glu-tRNA(Gln) amidotransferase A subunit family amidase